MSAIRYRITPIQPEAHLFEVELSVPAPAPQGQCFALPAWIPGSYMIREFARHVVEISAWAGRQPVALRKLDKHTWQADAVERGPLTLRYTVYAWDLSVRAAHLDATHGFFNGPSVFLRVLGQEDRPCELDIRRPAGRAYSGWQVATTLAEAPAGAKRHGFGLYRAADYDTLIDHPVEMGCFQRFGFTACGVPHEIVVTGRATLDGARLCADLKRICEWQIRLFGAPAPFERYLFLVMAVGEGYGGLEHRSSTALLCSRNDLPAPGMSMQTESYRSFLGLCSHEYFHAWNVKRIKPEAFVPYDLQAENYTRLLWAFEGFTSYYDDLALCRAGLISPEEYLGLIAKTITQVQRGAGRLKQSVAESSFDAWIKYYRQDENAPNAIVSYYAKGSLVGLALDLTLRARSQGRVSLDAVMRRLWRDYGSQGKGVPEEGICRVAEQVSGLRLKGLFERLTESTDELPLARLLRPFGVALRWQAASSVPTLGAKTLAEGDGVKLQQVFDQGPAQAAGLSAGDLIIAADGLRTSLSSLEALLKRSRPGQVLHLHVFRRDELMEFDLCLEAPAADQAVLDWMPSANASVTAARDAWLKG